jgi:hypothetical protein
MEVEGGVRVELLILRVLLFREGAWNSRPLTIWVRVGVFNGGQLLYEC